MLTEGVLMGSGDGSVTRTSRLEKLSAQHPSDPPPNRTQGPFDGTGRLPTRSSEHSAPILPSPQTLLGSGLFRGIPRVSGESGIGTDRSPERKNVGVTRHLGVVGPRRMEGAGVMHDRPTR